MQFFDTKSLEHYKEILFGPSLMEIGWEIFRWAPYVRWYKKTHPKTKVIVVTREGRLDLYFGAADEITTFKIDGDYSKYRPNMYRLDFFPKELHNKLVNRYKKLYPKAYIFKPPDTNNRLFFSPFSMDYDLTPNPDNKNLINTIIKENIDKTPIVVSPRHRIDMRIKGDRNWKIKYWHELFKLLKDSGKYLVFIAGSTPSYVRPKKDNCFIILEDVSHTSRVSNIGVTIEAIKTSKLTIGNQSAIPVLSNHLKTPTLFWGHEQGRHQVVENPLKTPCGFILEKTTNYSTHPNIVFDYIEDFFT